MGKRGTGGNGLPGGPQLPRATVGQQQPTQKPSVEYATKQDLEALAARVEALSAKDKPARKAATKEDAE